MKLTGALKIGLGARPNSTNASPLSSVTAIRPNGLDIPMNMGKTWQTYNHYAYGAAAVIGTFAAIVVIGWLMTTAFWAEWAPDMA